MITKHLLLLSTLLFITALTMAQPGTNAEGQYENKVFKESIKSVTLERAGEPLSLPIIVLGRPDQLKLSFDELGDYAENYSYTIELCNHDWTPSNLSTFTYLEGYESSNLPNYEFSTISLQHYTHHFVSIPNSNSRPTKAGNYVLKVFEANDPNNVVLVQKFFVARQRVSIDHHIRQSTNIKKRKTHQEVDFHVQHKGISLPNPMQSIHATIVQNSDFEHAREGLKPAFMQEDILSFDLTNGNNFQALREFRWFDTQSLMHYGERIKMTETYLGQIHVFVTEDHFRANKNYVFHRDINGHALLNTRDESKAATQSHYAMVHFTLPMNKPLGKGSLYIMGELSDWKATEKNRLTYNETRKAYEGQLYLKQGLYNYLYGYKASEDSQISYDFVEGNHFETENDYTIFIYHRPFGQRYDELIGVKTINTRTSN